MAMFKQYILNNKFPVFLSVTIILIYLFSTISGNRICNCEKTENNKRTRSSRIYNSNSYNHK